MPPIAVVSDASVALKWFHEQGEEDFGPARTLLDAYADRAIGLSVLDLTAYEIGNALIRGRGLDPEPVGLVLEALSEICPALHPTVHEQRHAAMLAARSGLTYYDAAYVAVARARDAQLATHDKELLGLGFGRRPTEILALLGP
jgi:predicted nucleic acid-binding protein